MAAIIVRRTPILSLVDRPGTLFDELERLAGDVWSTSTPEAHGGTAIPLEMYDTKDSLTIKADMPGFRKEDIDIRVENGYVTIKATSKPEELPEGTTTYLRERSYGEFLRTVSLPFEVDDAKIEATYEDGVLHLTMPKAEEAKPKHIEVKVK